MNVQPLHSVHDGRTALQNSAVPRPARRVPSLGDFTGGIVSPVDPGSAALLNLAYVSLHWVVKSYFSARTWTELKARDPELGLSFPATLT